MLNMELDTEVFELLIVELSVIICNDNPRKIEPRDDGLSDEFLGFGLNDLGHRLGFHPFGEVVNSYEQESSLC